MTNVMPNAKMATVAACTPTLIRLLTVKKCGVAMNSAMHSTIRPTSAPLFMIQLMTRWRVLKRSSVVVPVMRGPPFL